MVDALYPLAANIQVYSDKEMTTFVGETHIDNLDKVLWPRCSDAVLHPGWRARRSLLQPRQRRNYERSLRKSPSAATTTRNSAKKSSTISSTPAALTATKISAPAASPVEQDDARRCPGFPYKAHYTQSNAIVLPASRGGYPASFVDQIKKDFGTLPEGTRDNFNMPAPNPIGHNQVTLIDKNTRSVAWSFGYPMDVKRGDPDFPALLLASSWLGQHHRESSGILFQNLREARGLNYGDYAYIEYFPRGMYLMEPQPNLARHQQIFQIWIRPVETPTAVFSLRAGLYELDKMVKEGIPPA